MTRPAAPLIPATAELLKGWCGPVIIEGGTLPAPWNGIDDEVVWRDDREDWQEAVNLEGDRPGATPVAVTMAGEVRGILLDLRRPEVQDRVSRVWWGWSGARVTRCGDGAAVTRGGSAGRVWHARSWVAAYDSRAYGARYVPALADLPETDTLAWALWECWRAMEDR